MAAYLDIAGFKLLTLAPSVYVDEIEAPAAGEPGWMSAQLAYWSAWIDSRLAKRYAAPFQAPYPVAVTGWLARIVTLQLYLKRGVDATDNQYEDIRRADEEARAEIKEAADAKDGLFELPLRADTTVTGISKGAPFFASDASPYKWTDDQYEQAKDEGSI